MYDYINQRCPEASAIEYTDDELVSDAAHKWGAAPFHYVRAFWEKQLDTLAQLKTGKDSYI